MPLHVYQNYQNQYLHFYFSSYDVIMQWENNSHDLRWITVICSEFIKCSKISGSFWQNICGVVRIHEALFKLAMMKVEHSKNSVKCHCDVTETKLYRPMSLLQWHWNYLTCYQRKHKYRYKWVKSLHALNSTVVVVGQTVGSISSKTLAYDCLCTLEVCTTSVVAKSSHWHLGDFLCPVFFQAVLERVHCSAAYNFTW